MPVVVKDIEVHFGAFKDNLSNHATCAKTVKSSNCETLTLGGRIFFMNGIFFFKSETFWEKKNDY